METYDGKSIFKGIAVGKIWFYEKQRAKVERLRVQDQDAEIKRYEAAKETALIQLQALYERAGKGAGEDGAAVFEAHQMMLEDEDYNDFVRDVIKRQEVNAEYAVTMAGEHFSDLFAQMENEYFSARAADIKDVSNRVVTALCGGDMNAGSLEEPVVLAADDLAPSETIQLDKEKLLAFVTRRGSANSHTAILARTMNIPALTGIEVQKEWNGRTAAVDGFEGVLYLDPAPEILKRMEQRQKEIYRQQELLGELKGRADITADGKQIRLYANIGKTSDVEAVLQNDAAGIGLFRSEFLYLEKNDFPTEEEQFLAYKTVAQRMEGKKVIIRTLDIGADKQSDYFDLEKEENPAMGYRAIRICLTRTDIFKTQLRALLRAASYGNLAVMYPMIISVEEVRRIKAIVKVVQDELSREKLPFGEVEQGIMIETPAAAVMSDELAKEVDFFSIGTNDLTQYTLAIDRQNVKLEEFYDPHHPAILRMIQTVIDNGHAHGCWVGICGELGADPTLTETFIKMGIDELSVAPGSVLPIRKIIRQTKSAE